MPNFADYLRVREAAELLGVSPSTIRNWERTGKLPALRHPLNGYRLFARRDLEALLKQLGAKETTTR
ncbi:MAG: helix-turn-helix domain-containing protein [Planctomycetes bacterium]|nr:helix-turn-helix domain-containing protein [Planctomycetota bacterium]